MKENNYLKNKNIKRKVKLKKEFMVFIFILSLTGGSVSINAINKSIVHKKEEQYKLELLEKKKEEELNYITQLKNQFPSIHENGLKDAYDSSLIWERLESYDYSSIDNEKIVFLTYDDGPSTTNTPIILDTLKKHDVKATFFVTGKTLNSGGESAKQILKDMYNAGHSIGNHSYSHDYKLLYPNRKVDFEAFIHDFNKTDLLLQEILGDDFKTKTWRLPGGLMSWKDTENIKEYAKEKNIGVIDWNALNKDAEGKKKNPDELYEEAVNTSKGKNMIVLLMHDTYGKEATAQYTDKIINFYKNNGYKFKTLA